MAVVDSEECDWLFPDTVIGFDFFCLVITGRSFDDFSLVSFDSVAMRNKSSFFGSGFLLVNMSGFLTIFSGDEGKNFLGDFGLISGRLISLKTVKVG